MSTETDSVFLNGDEAVAGSTHFCPEGVARPDYGDIMPDTKDRTPAERLADAVLTQAFRDLKTLGGATNKSIMTTYDSARAFLLGENAEAAQARDEFCDALRMDPSFIVRMARAVVSMDEPRSSQK